MKSCIFAATTMSAVAFVSAFMAPLTSHPVPIRRQDAAAITSSNLLKLNAVPRRLEENVPGPLYVKEKVR